MTVHSFPGGEVVADTGILVAQQQLIEVLARKVPQERSVLIGSGNNEAAMHSLVAQFQAMQGQRLQHPEGSTLT